MTKIKLVFFLVIMSISGCGPQYKTTHTYVKPKTSHGQVCAFQCENSRLQCTQNSQLKKQTCESDNNQKQLQYQLCVERNGKKKCSAPYYKLCLTSKESCTTNYNRCYYNCGGKVSSRTTCVSNCDEK